jgi:hypothetical protein
VKVVQKLLGAPTIVVGSAWAGVVVEGVKEGTQAPRRPKYTKTAQKWLIFCTFWLKNCQKTFFAQKYLIRYTPKMIFEECIDFKCFVT